MRYLADNLQIYEADYVNDYLNIWQQISADMDKSGIGSIAYKMSDRESEEFWQLSQSVQDVLIKNGKSAEAQMIRAMDKGTLLYAEFGLLKLLLNKKWRNRWNNARDVLMAENLNYLLSEKYANKKIILVGATYHFARNMEKIAPIAVKGIKLHESVTAGNLLNKQYEQHIYTIGFTAFSGKYGTVKDKEEGKEVVSPPANSLTRKNTIKRLFLLLKLRRKPTGIIHRC